MSGPLTPPHIEKSLALESDRETDADREWRVHTNKGTETRRLLNEDTLRITADMEVSV